MNVRVLGCHGGESSEHRPTSFLIDGTIALDAGGLTGALTLAEQRRLRHLLVTHCHLDHVRDLALLADNVVGALARPIDVVAAPATLAALRRHFLNDVIWPDFTRIPTADAPVYRLVPIRAGESLDLDGHRVRAVRVDHPVHSNAFLIANARGTIAFSGDTGPTERLWKVLNRTPDLRALFLELSFPGRMQALADLTGHLTPRTITTELAKLAHDVPVLLYHLKPAFVRELVREVKALRNRRLHVLGLDERLRF